MDNVFTIDSPSRYMQALLNLRTSATPAAEVPPAKDVPPASLPPPGPLATDVPPATTTPTGPPATVAEPTAEAGPSQRALTLADIKALQQAKQADKKSKRRPLEEFPGAGDYHALTCCGCSQKITKRTLVGQCPVCMKAVHNDVNKPDCIRVHKLGIYACSPCALANRSLPDRESPSF